MAVTFTKVGEDLWGKTHIVWATVKLDNSYPTGGYGSTQGLSKAKIYGVSCTIIGAAILGVNGAASFPVVCAWDYAANKLMAFRVATFTPAGSVVGNVTVVGGGIGEAIGINPDSNAGVLSKAAATNRTIPIATFLGAAPTLSNTAQGQVALAQVSNAVDLSAVTVKLRFEVS